MFDIHLDERDSPKLPAPTNSRFWAIGTIASIAFHIVIAALLVVGAVREGDPIIHRRPIGESALASQITLLDSPVPAVPVAEAAPRPAAVAPAAPALPADGNPGPSVVVTPAVRLGPSASAPAAATPPSSGGAVAAGIAPTMDLAALGSDYRHRLLDHIAAHRRPPPAGTGLGTVYVNFALARNGDVQSVAIAVSSGEPALDRAALDSIQSASPMPAIPAGFPDTLTVMLPVDFRRLDQRVTARP